MMRYPLVHFPGSPYADLGLPSGTLWKKSNEPAMLSSPDAIKAFGRALPTVQQFNELRDCCRWSWDSTRHGYSVTGPNGTSIFLPATGTREIRRCTTDSHGIHARNKKARYAARTRETYKMGGTLQFNTFDVRPAWFNYSHAASSVRLVRQPTYPG